MRIRLGGSNCPWFVITALSSIHIFQGFEIAGWVTGMASRPSRDSRDGVLKAVFNESEAMCMCI